MIGKDPLAKIPLTRSPWTRSPWTRSRQRRRKDPASTCVSRKKFNAENNHAIRSIRYIRRIWHILTTRHKYWLKTTHTHSHIVVAQWVFKTLWVIIPLFCEIFEWEIHYFVKSLRRRVKTPWVIIPLFCEIPKKKDKNPENFRADLFSRTSLLRVIIV